MGRSNNSSNLPTQFYWISSRQLLLALPPASPSPRLCAFHLHERSWRPREFARAKVSVKSTIGSPYKRAGHARYGRGFSHTYARRIVNLFAKKETVSIDYQRHNVMAKYSLVSVIFSLLSLRSVVDLSILLLIGSDIENHFSFIRIEWKKLSIPCWIEILKYLLIDTKI